MVHISVLKSQTIIKEIREVISNINNKKTKQSQKLSKNEKISLINTLEQEMKKAANELDFERAMQLRDALFELKSE